MSGASNIKITNLDFACRRIRIHSIHSFQWQIWGGPQDSMEAPFAIKSQPSCQMSSLCLLHYYVIFSLFLDSKRRDTTFTNHILKIRQMSIDIIDIRSPSKEKSLERASLAEKKGGHESHLRPPISTQLKQVTVDITRCNLTHCKKVNN